MTNIFLPVAAVNILLMISLVSGLWSGVITGLRPYSGHHTSPWKPSSLDPSAVVETEQWLRAQRIRSVQRAAQVDGLGGDSKQVGDSMLLHWTQERVCPE